MAKDRKHDANTGVSRASVPTLAATAAAAVVPKGYESYLASQLASARSDFNTSINWAFSSTCLILTVVILSDKFPNIKSLICVLILIVLALHFAFRLAKAYLNLLRWACILQDVTRITCGELLSASEKHIAEIRAELAASIEKYHLRWLSPISKRRLASAILLEFGFLYFLLIPVAVAAWILTHIPYSGTIPILLESSLAIALTETLFFIRSPYIRETRRPDNMPW
jgi:hypothetical protein